MLINHRLMVRAGGACQGRHRKPRPSLQDLIQRWSVERTTARAHPVRGNTACVRFVERVRGVGGRDA